MARQSFVVVVALEACEAALAVRAVLFQSSSMTRKSPWARTGLTVEARIHCCLDIRMRLFAAYELMPAPRTDLDSPVQKSYWVDSHHGYEDAYTLLEEGIRVEVACHGGRMDSRHATPLCRTTRRTARALILHDCAGWSDANETSAAVVAQALLVPHAVCLAETSAASWALSGLPLCVVAMQVDEIARPNLTARSRRRRRVPPPRSNCLPNRQNSCDCRWMWVSGPMRFRRRSLSTSPDTRPPALSLS